MYSKWTFVRLQNTYKERLNCPQNDPISLFSLTDKEIVILGQFISITG